LGAAAPGAAAEAPAAGGGGGFGRFGFGGGPSVVPGDYTLTLASGATRQSKTVRVDLDPRVKISQADLEAQLSAALELRELSSRVSNVVNRVDNLTAQLNTLSGTVRRGASEGDGAPAELAAALDELKKLRATLVREGQFGYRYPPKLREEVNSLLNSVSGPIAAPTEAQKLRMREVKEEAEKTGAELNAIINGSIRRLNEKLAGQPHVNASAPVR